jgi:hypothetical protein
MKFDEKTHGYRETELNMKQIFADAERHPNQPVNAGKVDMEYQVGDIDVKNTPGTVAGDCYAEISNFSSGFP